MMLESYKILNTEKWLRPFRHIYAMLVTTLAFVFFRADNLSNACRFIWHMFVPSGDSVQNALFMKQITPMYLIMLVLAAVFSMPVMWRIKAKAASPKVAVAYEYGSYGATLVLLALCILTLSSASYNPFIYFRF